MKAISLFMDVEDPVNPLADDAAKDFAELFTAAGVKGSFCLTGEKCRTLTARGRQDVAAAYLPHSLGLHTNTHSFHPSTMELLADLEWEEGCRAAIQAERPGMDAFTNLIGRPPEFWGGGGNTWSPEITEALKQIGIPAYSYALTEFADHAPHRFNGVVGLPQALSISELDWQDDDRAAPAVERVLREIEESAQPWLGIFVGHPTKFRYKHWWDIPYYAGRTPPTPEYGEPVADEAYEAGKQNLTSFLAIVSKRYDVVGISESLTRLNPFREPTLLELNEFKARTAKNLRSAIHWPIHRPGLSPELIVSKTLALAGTAQIAG